MTLKMRFLIITQLMIILFLVAANGQYPEAVPINLEPSVPEPNIFQKLAEFAKSMISPSIAYAPSDPEIIVPDDKKKFQVAVIGDSIAWGAGLNEEKKYYSQVRSWIAERKNIPLESVEMQVYAHTGATLSKETNDPIRSPDLSSGNPTASQQADLISNPNNVDLILLSAGINDVGVADIIKLGDVEGFWNNLYSILGGGTCSIAEINKRSANLREPMSLLLQKLLEKCPNAKIVVTGYYPIISEDSTGLTETIKALEPDSQKIDEYKNLDEPEQRNQLRDKSNEFFKESTRSLREAVNDINSNSLNNRVAFAQLKFASENCYGAEQSLLWKIKNFDGVIKTDDNKFESRMKLLNDMGWVCACEKCSSPSAKIARNVNCDMYRQNKFVAVGHPNEKGAVKYRNTIIKTINDTWPDWLNTPVVQAFQVMPLSVASGRSFTIDYTASDNYGSGLKHVELWRKDEMSDWQEIKREEISGEDDPISGSFTDAPSVPGKYLYGLHVIDKADNWNDQSNSNTYNPAISFEPVEVEVISLEACITPEAEAWFNKGKASFDQKQYKEAIKYYDEAIKNCSLYEEAWLGKGNAYLAGSFGFWDENDPSEAIRCYDEVIKLNPQNKKSWNNKGTALVDLGKDDEAIQCYDMVIRIDSQYAESWVGKGRALYEMGDYAEALNCVNEAITLEPEIPVAWELKGDILEALGSDEAQSAFDKADELEDVHEPTHEAKGAIAYKL